MSHQSTWTCRSTTFFFLGVVSLAAACADAADPQAEAKRVLTDAGKSSGFFVHLGCGNGELTEALKQNDSTHVHGLSRSKVEVAAARNRWGADSKYGDLAADMLSGSELPYVDNLVNLLVVETLDVPMDEVTRVLTPGGVAMIRSASGWDKIVKPWPDTIDEWSHYLHDASGNSVAHDSEVGPPRHLQWVGSPRWSRHHDRMASMSALVSTAGRMFYIMDEGSRISIQLPPKWKLISRDAFNGSVLWKRDIQSWQSHLWPLKSGPTQLSRRLVSTDDTVYVTLSINDPLSALDAATGETIRTYEGTDATEEVITTGGILFLVVRKGEAELEKYAPVNATVGDQALVGKDYFWNEEPRVLMAVDAKTGEKLWTKQTTISPLTLAADSSQIYYHDGTRVVAVDQRTGNPAWQTEPVSRRQSFTFNFGPRLVIYDGVVLFSGGDGKMISLDAKSGVELWNSSFPNSGYQSPQDLMVVNGLVWLAPLTQGKDSGVYTGRDPKTGEVKKSFAPDIETYWFHHRCYIAKGTDKFLMPSRTGVEFVDPNQEHWEIHHWVRGGCLYGVMPCNGLTYTPPHDCACYPEAKLFGFNALAPAAPTRPVPGQIPEQGRLEKGPAYNIPLADVSETSTGDWPTYRHDAQRSGAATQPVGSKVQAQWTTKLGGRLTPPVIAGGLVYVAQTDTHTLLALDETTGDRRWHFTAGGRIDSPPTVHRGRIVFGCVDGWLYCLSADDGQLVWKYRVAPLDRRTMAYEQLESLWPVHGTALIHNEQVYAVAGRSIFLDGGLRLVRLDLATGKKLSETIMDEKNPETGNNIQEKLQTLQMPVGLPDILSCDGKHIFMKSQKFDLEGNRLEIGPNSGEFAKQVEKQRGEDAHIFAPMGYLDDSWFHRSYWVLGQSFAGGHGGYYQAGKVAPSGRLLVNGNGYVFGYGRKPQYLRWTTTLEHQLFAAEPEPPEIPKTIAKPQADAGVQYAGFPKTPSLDPTAKPITVEAWITTTQPNGIVLARGGPSEGFSLEIEGGKPSFHVRAGGTLKSATGSQRVVGGWHHLVGVLQQDSSMQLYVDGELVGEARAAGLISKDPAQSLEIGTDLGGNVGPGTGTLGFTGIIDEVRLYFLAANAKQVRERFTDGSEISSEAVIAIGFDDGSARDLSVHANNGTLEGGVRVDGKFGGAVQFSQRSAGGGRKRNNNNSQAGSSLVKPKWAKDVPIYVRSMVLAGENLFIAGPPDIIDEEETFEKLTEKDPEVQKLLDEQDAVLEGSTGGLLFAVNMHTGEVQQRVVLDELPTWDGLSSANGKLFISTLGGSVVCFGE